MAIIRPTDSTSVLARRNIDNMYFIKMLIMLLAYAVSMRYNSKCLTTLLSYGGNGELVISEVNKNIIHNGGKVASLKSLFYKLLKSLQISVDLPHYPLIAV